MMRARVEQIGESVVDAARAVRDLWLVYIGTLAGLARTHSRRPRGEVAHQMYVIGNRSLVFVAVTLGFIGMVMIYQACLQFGKVTGDFSQVGVQFIRLIVSDFAPTLCGMMLATRVGAGIAAEIGSMKVTEQVDALRMSGVLPVDYLIVPRFLASIVMTVVLTIIGGAIGEQLYAIGNRSLVFVIVTLGFIGMVMTYEACLQLSRVVGDYSQVGPQYLRLIVSDFAPTLTALMLATRVGAGIAAEIGSMKVTEQIDALRMSGVLPIDYLIVPRFVASVVMTLALTIVGGVVMYGAGGLTAQYSFGVNPHTFFDFQFVRPRHVVMMVVKALSYGAAIPVVAGFCGLRARGSSEGVGWATTAAVIGSSFAVIVLDFVISAAALFVTGGDL